MTNGLIRGCRAMVLVVGIVTAGSPNAASTAAAQTRNNAPAPARAFRARLSPVPIDLTMASTIAGVGSVTAVLNGNKLTVDGSFEGLRSPATIVQLRRGQRGVRGDAVLDLTATKATSGTISGTVELTPQLMQDLQNSRLYVQLHSERAPDGNLWGWLMPDTKGQEKK